jgi:hypothetical protein
VFGGSTSTDDISETDTTMKLTACSDNMTLWYPFGGMSENFKISALGTSTVLEIAFKDYILDGFTILEMEPVSRSIESFTDSEVTFFVNFSPSSACIIRRKIYDAEGSVCKSKPDSIDRHCVGVGTEVILVSDVSGE